MPPLILHNVPDEELYVGEDGVQRPYAMLFPGSEGHTASLRTKKQAPESGAFGKSTRRSRTRATTPARREDPTILAADAIFTKYLTESAPTGSDATQRKQSLSSTSQSNTTSQTALIPLDTGAGSLRRQKRKEPTEVILRGFNSAHQWAAIQHYEAIAGRICEDYPRDPPVEQRRYKADLRDPATLRTGTLTAEERTKAMRFAGGDNWIKITFESAEAAEAAQYSSPQTVLGYQVYAEPYRGVPPTNAEAIPISIPDTSSRHTRSSSKTAIGASANPQSSASPAATRRVQENSLSPPGSQTSSSTLDTATLSTTTTTTSTATITGNNTQSNQTATPSQPKPAEDSQTDSIYCRRIPTAKKMQLLPADQALLPQPSLVQRILAQIPFLAFFSANIIGTEIPRTENGEFNWVVASVYWKVWWWLDFWFGLCGGDLAGGEGKDE